MLIKICKIFLIFNVAFFFTVVAINNLTDPNTNMLAVQHVLNMDTIFATSPLKWRAVPNLFLQKAAYAFIITWQVTVALILWFSIIQLSKSLKNSHQFEFFKSIAVLGLCLGFLLYGMLFLTIGDEWFSMWQSTKWNAEAAAARFLILIGFVLLFISQRD